MVQTVLTIVVVGAATGVPDTGICGRTPRGRRGHSEGVRYVRVLHPARGRLRGYAPSPGLHHLPLWGVKNSVVVVPGVNFMFYDDFWRTSYLREIPCPKA